jgi:hypothetical protein
MSKETEEYDRLLEIYRDIIVRQAEGLNRLKQENDQLRLELDHQYEQNNSLHKSVSNF